MLKRGLSVFLAATLLMLCFFCVPVFAAEPEFDIRDYTFEDLQDMTTDEKKELMAKFIETYNPYGLRDMMEAEAQAKAETRAESLQSGLTVQPMWKSDSDSKEDGQQMATHQLITLEALYSYISSYEFYNVTDGTTAFVVALCLAAASGLPDLDENGSAFAGHFYNPITKTGTNIFYKNARDNVEDHYNAAYQMLKNDPNMSVNSDNYAKVLEELGRALHYIQDVCEPHHAWNLVAVLSPHVTFEAYVENFIDTLLPHEQTFSKAFYAETKGKTAGELAHLAAKNGQEFLAQTYTNNEHEEWDLAGRKSLNYAVQHSAKLIYKLFSDCGMVS